MLNCSSFTKYFKEQRYLVLARSTNYRSTQRGANQLPWSMWFTRGRCLRLLRTGHMKIANSWLFVLIHLECDLLWKLTPYRVPCMKCLL